MVSEPLRRLYCKTSHESLPFPIPLYSIYGYTLLSFIYHWIPCSSTSQEWHTEMLQAFLYAVEHAGKLTFSM